ncbi:four helix bundle protein [Alloalcanivorax profundimaris]|uniref:four helix bundle protein n=1 Tax=Alloalcanivorax profundimaris TaxID=2735259 RepID=UPI002B27B021|nr:four helix bundle protein [Alloalcanivorax profundimaris]
MAREKSRAFALRVVKLCRLLQERDREYVLSRQLLRSGTAIGALIREAEQAESRADFVHKLSIALKEASETGYWLDLLTESGYLDSVHGQSMMTDTEELLKILTAIIRTTKRRG